MKDIPIIFSGPMVRALLEGRKTMTRRLAHRDNGTPSTWTLVRPGDRLWVRESIWWHDAGGWRFSADKAAVTGRGHCKATSNPSVGKGLPSIHMPRWASRLTLEVTATKTERLTKISPADAIAEGISAKAGSQTIDCDTPNPVNEFELLWKSLHGADSWFANPEVVALTFTVHKSNIDAMKVAA